MCGIVGYIGSQKACSLTINGLKRLEYRGYDSAGMALIENGEIKVVKKKGKVAELQKLIEKLIINEINRNLQDNKPNR